ncbi:enoyl CoA hydratase-like protein [Xylaria bambusicola]|uniref:enoyl CoA hydratase-like protein n=1 Tax=Xylaria bambusicola TaxID=326684 RepID=UPI0020074A3F|nr:enoyl CoA hydratase-like protein [Xylaria bambusicola]KAI0522028.1 enoyl CoA hydratase-like protein [Xylaria bambusicola]
MAPSLEGYDSFKHFLISSPSEYVAHVETNRPEKLNAFIEDMWLELGQIFRKLSHDPSVRVVIFSAVGERAFTAGLDVQAAQQSGMLIPDGKSDGARAATRLRRHIQEFQDSVSAIEHCEKPVICVMHGISIGLAIDLSCCADIRICAKDAKFCVKEVDIGLASDIGTLSRLPKIVGNNTWVKEVCLSARLFGAEEALAVGFVSRVLESKAKAIESATEMATLIASKSPVAVQGTKNILNHSRDNSVAENLRYTGVWNAAMLQSNDVSTAMLSGIKKTKPRFEKL